MKDLYHTLLSAPATAPINRQELDKLIHTHMNQIPVETLQQAAHAQQIEEHNAAIDKRKAAKKKARVFKRVLNSVKKKN